MQLNRQRFLDCVRNSFENETYTQPKKYFCKNLFQFNKIFLLFLISYFLCLTRKFFTQEFSKHGEYETS